MTKHKPKSLKEYEPDHEFAAGLMRELEELGEELDTSSAYDDPEMERFFSSDNFTTTDDSDGEDVE